MNAILRSLILRLRDIWRRFHLPLILAALASACDAVLSDPQLRQAAGFLHVDLGSACTPEPMRPCSVPSPAADGILLCLLAEQAAAFFLVFFRERTGSAPNALKAGLYGTPPAVLLFTTLAVLAAGDLQTTAAFSRAMLTLLGALILASFSVPFFGPAPRPGVCAFAGRLISSALLAAALALAALLPHQAFFTIVPQAVSMSADAAMAMMRRYWFIRAACRFFLFSFFFVVFLTREQSGESCESAPPDTSETPGTRR